jgi:hypothetical protein
VVTSQLWIEFEVLCAGFNADTKPGVMAGALGPMVLPPKFFELVTPFDMPFSEVASSVACLGETVSPMWMIRAKDALILIATVFHL